MSVGSKIRKMPRTAPRTHFEHSSHAQTGSLHCVVIIGSRGGGAGNAAGPAPWVRQSPPVDLLEEIPRSRVGGQVWQVRAAQLLL